MKRLATALACSVSLLVSGCATYGTSPNSLVQWCEENEELCVLAGILIVTGTAAIIIAAHHDDNDHAYTTEEPVSDSRLKTDIHRVGETANGLPVYTWRYLGGQDRFSGVMAEDVLARPDLAHAVTRRADGLLAVDYGALGLTVVNAHLMHEAGQRAVEVYHHRQAG